MKFRLTDERRLKLIEVAHEYYQKTGFPYPQLTPQEIWGIFFQLEDSKAQVNKPQQALFSEMAPTELEVKAVGQKIANYFHPHIYESFAMGMRSAVQSYNEPKRLRAAVEKAFDYMGGVDPANMLRMLKLVQGTQVCSNFRPHAAKAVYDRYLHGRYVLDPSTGYGGRLVGFLACKHKQSEYIGVDPAKKTCISNKRMVKFFDARARVTIINKPFEETDLSGFPPFDLAFTSPPYFKKEIYSGESTQSCHRYPEYHNWLTLFWYIVVRGVFNALRAGGVFVINIQDVNIKSKKYPLVDDTIRHAQEVGFDLTERLHMRMPSFGANLDKVKFEAVLVFTKP